MYSTCQILDYSFYYKWSYALLFKYFSVLIFDWISDIYFEKESIIPSKYISILVSWF